jgi:hypothetical protein
LGKSASEQGSEQEQRGNGFHIFSFKLDSELISPPRRLVKQPPKQQLKRQHNKTDYRARKTHAPGRRLLQTIRSDYANRSEYDCAGTEKNAEIGH